MIETHTVKKIPVHWMAWLAFIGSLVAVVLAFYGSLAAEKHLASSPLRQARGPEGSPPEPSHWYERAWVNAETSLFGDRKLLELTERSKIANYTVQIVAFVLPFFLGLGSALTGGWAMTLIERSKGKYKGNLQCVFSMLIGSFAAVIAGCMMFSLYVWKWMPSVYTE